MPTFVANLHILSKIYLLGYTFNRYNNNNKNSQFDNFELVNKVGTIAFQT